MVCVLNATLIVAVIVTLKILIINFKKEKIVITLTNDFHNTEVRLNPKDGKLSARQVKRAEKVLCGMDDCICGNEAGMRGAENPDIEFHEEWVDNKYVITASII
jgi:hypothetical protein